MAAFSLSSGTRSILSLIFLISICDILAVELRGLSHKDDATLGSSGDLARTNVPGWERCWGGCCFWWGLLGFSCRPTPQPLPPTTQPLPPTTQPPVRCRASTRYRNVVIPGCQAQTITINSCRGRCYGVLKLMPVEVIDGEPPHVYISDFIDSSERSCCKAIEQEPLIMTVQCDNSTDASVTMTNPTKCQCS